LGADYSVDDNFNPDLTPIRWLLLCQGWVYPDRTYKFTNMIANLTYLQPSILRLRPTIQ